MRGIVSAKPLLNKPERILYARLVRAFPGHVVLAQVALSRLLVLDPPDTAGAAAAVANPFRQWVADFVVCRADFTALAVVELDECATARDAERDRERERQRDRRKDQLLQSAGIKVIRLAVNDIPDEPALKALVAMLPLHASTAQLARRAS